VKRDAFLRVRAGVGVVFAAWERIKSDGFTNGGGGPPPPPPPPPPPHPHPCAYRTLYFLSVQALEIRLKMLGEKDLGTAATRTAIANVHYQSEEYAQALEIYKRVLSVQEEMLGHDHLDVAATLQNMAQVLKHSDLQGSIDMYQRSLAIIVGIYGHNHRSVADTLNQIAAVLCGMGQHVEGLEKYQEVRLPEPCILEVVEGYEECLGGDGAACPLGGTALAVSSPASPLHYLLSNLFDNVIFWQALDISMSLLGNTHPDIATLLVFIGATHERRGDKDKAAGYYKQAAEIWEGIGVEWREHLKLTRVETAKEWAILTGKPDESGKLLQDEFSPEINGDVSSTTSDADA